MHAEPVNSRHPEATLRPLEQLALDVADHRVTPGAGERAAAALAASQVLSAHDLLDWFRTANWLAHREDLWERALLLGRLLAAAVDGLPESAPPRAVAECRAAWTELVHLSVVHRPDGALFASGVRAGRIALESARALGDDQLAGQVLYRLGTLYLDPFSRARDLWWEEHRLWLSLGPRQALAGLPEPGEALEIAEEYLREALVLRTGAGLGYTCKALAQAVQQRGFVAGGAGGARASRAGHASGRALAAGAVSAADGADGVRDLCVRALALIPVDDLVARAGVEAIRSGSWPAEETSA